MSNVIAFPRFGKYTPIVIEGFKELGIPVLEPPPITKKTIELGVKYAPEQVCFPFKTTLGTFIECLEKGANILLQVHLGGWCVLRCYWTVQNQILKDLGYQFEMIPFYARDPLKIYKILKRLNPKLNIFKILMVFIKILKIIKKIDEEEFKVNSNSRIKVAILGEIYMCNEEAVNMNIIKKLQNLGVQVDRWTSLWGLLVLIFEKMFRTSSLNLRKYRKKAKQYFNELCGGLLNENIVRAIKCAEEGCSGIICLKPMYCSPGGIGENAFKKISKDYSVPLLTLSFDELSNEIHFDTRIEAFIETLKRRQR